MATYHCSVKVISRGKGQSAIASAAYRAGEKLHDLQTGEVQDYSRKQHVEHCEIMTPDGAADWTKDREQLWNRVEQAERRKDAQLAREVEIALPREIPAEARRELVRNFVREEFTNRGMVADVAIHCPDASDGREQPHAHIMLTLRPIEGDGFAAKKDRSWNDKELVENWRQSWAERVNSAYQAHDLALEVDHRSHVRRGIEDAPTVHLGPAAAALERRGIETERGGINRLVLAANQALHQARQMVERATARAKEAASQVMDRGARIMSELAQIDMGALDEALQIRQAEKILQERQRQRQQEQDRSHKPGKIPAPGRGRGGPDFGL